MNLENSSLHQPLLDLRNDEDEEAIQVEEDDGGNDQEVILSSSNDYHRLDDENDVVESNDSFPKLHRFLHTTFLRDYNYEESCEKAFSVKLLKFIFLTFSMIGTIHWLVKAKIFSDRDHSLKFLDILVFEGNLIVSDCIVFFLVGRLWRQRGVDHLAWILPLLLCNVYFESQQFFSWLRHSVTLYEMHCIWPWQLWVFVGLLVPLISCTVLFHAKKAYQDRRLWRKIGEMAFFILFYLVPVISSPYFHFHHWFAGWFLGMQCNFDLWWSRIVMAWCWGMYINGIAVYGRDPLLTCDYAYFVATDQHCSFVEPNMSSLFWEDMKPAADWRNCSAHGYHP